MSKGLFEKTLINLFAIIVFTIPGLGQQVSNSGKEHTVVYANITYSELAAKRFPTKIALNENESDSIVYYMNTKVPSIMYLYEADQLVAKIYYSRTGEVNIEMRFQYGLQVGEEKWFHHNGEMMHSIPFKAGLAHGVAYQFDMKGNTIDSTLYNEGQKGKFE